MNRRIVAVRTFLVLGGSVSSKTEADDATTLNGLSIVIIVETKRANAVLNFMVEGGTVEENE